MPDRLLIALVILTFAAVLWGMAHDPHPVGDCRATNSCAVLDSLLHVR